MSTRRWQPSAAPVAQISTVTVGGTIEVDDEFTLTIGGKSFTVVGGSTDADTVAEAIATAWNALDPTAYPEFAEITAAEVGSGGELTLTEDTAGKPFVCTVATTESGGGAADDQTFGIATTVAATGPNYWSDPNNWSGGAVPVNSDDVVIENSSVPILYGLAQSAVTLTSMRVNSSFTGTIGLPEVNTDSATPYQEYRATHLAINVTTCTIGDGPGTGSGRIKIDFGSVQTLLIVRDTGSSEESDLETLQIKGTHTSNVVNVFGGSIAIAGYGGEASAVATLKAAGGADVRCGPGVTLTTVTIDDATVEINSNSTTTRMTNGELAILGTATVTTLTLDGGTCNYLSSGTVTTLNVGTNGTIDYSADTRARTVTNCNIYAGSTLNDPGATVTFSNGIVLVRARIDDVTLDVGVSRTLTPS